MNRGNELFAGVQVYQTHFVALLHADAIQIVALDAGVASGGDDGFTCLGIDDPYGAVGSGYVECIFVLVKCIAKTGTYFIINRGYDFASEV